MMKRKVEEVLYCSDERKKFRNEDPNPSVVLHLRSLPDEISEFEIASVAIPFGLVNYLVLTRQNAQALIEMESKEVSETMFEYYQKHVPYLRNKRCFIQYSFHTTIQGMNTSMKPDAEKAVKLVNQMCESMENERVGAVLRIIIEDWNHEKITSLHLFKIFQHYGTLEKIVVYLNKGIVQGFIQYSDPFSVRVAKALTNNLCIYPRSCTMRLSFSNREALDITREDDMTRDFVRHPITPQELKIVDVNVSEGMKKHGESSHNSKYFMETALEPIFNQDINYPDEAEHVLRTLAPAIHGLIDDDQEMRDNFYYPNNSSGTGGNYLIERVSPLLIVSNLNETKVNPDVLFTLFGCYGDVTRVKIMYNRQDTALIQFACEEHAHRALQYLNGLVLYGRPLRASFSKHDKISHRIINPHEDTFDNSLHRDYSEHKLHRFKKPSSRNHINVYEPNKLLHIAGLTDHMSEEDLKTLFLDRQFGVRKIKIFTTTYNKMALVELVSVEAAVEALIDLHDFDVGGSRLKISFGKGFLNL